jgi:hypothetical protein
VSRFSNKTLLLEGGFVTNIIRVRADGNVGAAGWR